MLTYSSSLGIRPPVSLSTLDHVARLVERAVPVVKEGVEVSFVTLREIRKLNYRFRGKNRPTDVVSFSFAHSKEIPKQPPGFRLVGQMYLSPEIIRDQAKRFKLPVKVEFVRIFIHGLLHCSGLDHQKKSEARIMFTLQEKILRTALKRLNLRSALIPKKLSDEYFKEFFIFPET